MKYGCIIFFCFLAVTFANDTKEEIKKSHESCQNDPATKLKDDTLDNLRKGKPVDDPNLPKHTLCMNVVLGIQKENGDIDKDALKKDLEKEINDANKVSKILDACGTRAAGNTATEAATALSICLHKHLGHEGHHDHHDSHDQHHH
ncbi:unnamed protein product [Psylliodes chrysocephalus]|uniref:Uncharacterized protein n=1 Tax=Psylliodes chrysocephalus TaxID=3402493 RepID=A0A9P0CXQ2_9CUCU|nr:unnamed protein product [Psylliodes chrysocephala]